MTGWVIYDKVGYERNSWFADELVRNLNARLVIAENLQYGVGNDVFFVYDGREISAPEFAVQRSIYPMLSLTLEACGTRVFNSARVCDVCNDKRKTHLMAQGLGIPTLKTYFADKDFFYAPNPPYILKGAAGHGGSEVFEVASDMYLEQAADKIHGNALLYQQKATDIGRDKRAYLLGDRVLATVERHAREGFKSNFSLGGEAVLSDITQTENEIIKKIYGALKSDFIGIDFIYSDGDVYLNEVEDIVGTRMLYALTDIDAAKVYAEYILSEI